MLGIRLRLRALAQSTLLLLRTTALMPAIIRELAVRRPGIESVNECSGATESSLSAENEVNVSTSRILSGSLQRIAGRMTCLDLDVLNCLLCLSRLLRVYRPYSTIPTIRSSCLRFSRLVLSFAPLSPPWSFDSRSDT